MDTIKNLANWSFMQEPIWRWFVFLIAIGLLLGAWRWGIMSIAGKA